MRETFAALLLSAAVAGGSASAQVQLVDDIARRKALDRYRAGEELMQAELWEKAEREFKAAVALDPLFTLAHYSLGQTYMAMRRPASAVQAYVDCREAFETLGAFGQKERAETEIRREDEIRELRNSLAMLQGGRVTVASPLAMTVRIEERLRVLEQGRMRSASNVLQIPAELSLALGSAYFRLERLADAEREYLVAIAADSTLGAAHNNLAVVYMLTGRYELAEASVRQAERNGFHVSPQLKDDLRAAAAHE